MPFEPLDRPSDGPSRYVTIMITTIMDVMTVVRHLCLVGSEVTPVGGSLTSNVELAFGARAGQCRANASLNHMTLLGGNVSSSCDDY